MACSSKSELLVLETASLAPGQCVHSGDYCVGGATVAAFTVTATAGESGHPFYVVPFKASGGVWVPAPSTNPSITGTPTITLNDGVSPSTSITTQNYPGSGISFSAPTAGVVSGSTIVCSGYVRVNGSADIKLVIVNTGATQLADIKVRISI